MTELDKEILDANEVQLDAWANARTFVAGAASIASAGIHN